MNVISEQSYYNERRDLLADVITEYMTDKSITAYDIHRDIMAELNGWVTMGSPFMEKAQLVKKLMKGDKNET